MYGVMGLEDPFHIIKKSMNKSFENAFMSFISARTDEQPDHSDELELSNHSRSPETEAHSVKNEPLDEDLEDDVAYKETTASYNGGTTIIGLHMSTCDIDIKDEPLRLKDEPNLDAPTPCTPVQCDICKLFVLNEIDLVTHRDKHTPEQEFYSLSHECNICRRRFSTSDRLKIHVRIHTGEKLQCDICQKEFSNFKVYFRHKRHHNGLIWFNCEVCHKQFVTKSAVAVHMRTHTREKPYGCNICQKQFSHQSAFLIHTRTHSGEKPFECDICHKKFACRSNFIRHTRIHSNEKHKFKTKHCKLSNKTSN